ncbi:MAG: hypothetical protein NTZ53_00825 [Cyanobacteria bacterium]|nr:hypothetical protein [Cyanobacteriota bacterium]
MLRRIWQIVLAGLLFCLLILWPFGQSIHAAVPDPSRPEPLNSGAGVGLQKQPELVKVGIYITRLDNFNLKQKSFDASFWLWSVMPNDVSSRLDSVEFVNSEAIKLSNSYSKKTPSGVWNQRKVMGTFHHDWDMRNFPFDHQDLLIELEESEDYLSELVYVPDPAESIVDGDLEIKGWRIVSSEVRAGSKTYMSHFGDPAIKAGNPTSFTRMNVTVRLKRTNMTAFWKYTAGAYVAAVIALSSYAFHVDQGQTMSPRFGLLAAAVFAAIISLRSESSELGTTEYNTLVDQVHLIALLYVIVATLTGVYTWTQYRRHNDCYAIQRLGRRVALVSTVIMVIMVVGVVKRAAFA